ncbi:S8 family peptidase [Shewanella acanthi]|uniref:S8 family peptidase n=1 Tax=Shewanella acanthi TaxID=2864212 RepID=UPI002574ADB7|nr:S8 family serine peptidase [Shewanella acanthi]
MNKVAVMVATALYVGSGVASTATVAPSDELNSVWATQPADYAPQPLAEESYTWENQVNKTIKKQREIFTAEADIHGVHKYIVQLSDAPIATYDGGVAQLAATQNTVVKARGTNTPLNLNQPQLKAYNNYLAEKRASFVAQAQALQGVDVKVSREFSVALNGFVTELTQEQAQRLAKVPGVKRITREKIYELKTFSTPAQTGATSVWSSSALNTLSNKGEGMVVGIIDTGINYDHPSFAEVGGDGFKHTNPNGSGKFLGDCVDSPEYCNDKLIGIYSYPEITQAYTDPVFAETRPAIGLDYNSHGSHVAGTVAGNIIKDLIHSGPDFAAQSKGVETGLKLDQVSGMAPHANIISYQVCWPGGSGDPYAGCPSSAIVAAIEQSAIDNVDVINASLGSLEEDPWLDPMEQAFLNAAASGVFVAVAAGNSGPDLMTADHSSPWVTTVAAHTADQIVGFKKNTVEQMSGGATAAPADIIGATRNFNSVTGLMVDASKFKNANETVASAIKNCDKPFPEGTFDLADNPDTEIDESAQDVIVLCSRSSYPLMTKAANVKAGGAEGIVIANQSSVLDSSAPEIPYAVPGSLIKFADGAKLRTWLATGSGHMATITAGAAEIKNVDKERVAHFSGRGPSYFGIDTLFVDIAAPGVDIFAAASDDQPFTKNPSAGDWATLSGTSMASPHVAGAAALLRQSHPDWTPMQVQSALLMTASNDLTNSSFLDFYSDFNETSALQDVGAGRMHVELADKVGLVLDESMDNMATANPNLGGRPKNLNTAYMVDNECPTECSFVRTFTATEDATWTVNAETWFGDFDISVAPQSFTIKAGESQSIVVTAKTRKNVAGTSVIDLTGNQGQIVLTSDNPASPVLELPVWTYEGDSGLPDYLKINAHRKSATLNVGPFNTAEITDFTARSFGMVKGEDKTVHLYTDKTGADPFDTIEIDGKDVVNYNHVEWTDVPEGAKLLAGSVVGSDYGRVLVFMGQDTDGDGLPSMDETLCMSTTYTIANFCTITNPQAGRYFTVYMNLATISTGQTDMGRDISFSTAVVTGDNGNLTVKAPSQIPGYEEYNLELAYHLPEMEVGNTYFGGFDIGSNANDAGNLGFVPVIINQIDKDVTFTASRETAHAGEVVEFNINVIANNEAAARDFALNAKFPEAIQIIPGTIVASNATPGTPVLENNSINLSGVQETTKDVVRNYKITNNQNDPMCSLTAAKSPYPGYLELKEGLGWRTLEGVQGTYRNEFKYNLKDLMNTQEDITFPLFNKFMINTIKLNPAGLISLNTDRRAPAYHVEFPSGGAANGIPEFIIAPYWTGDNTIPARFDGGYGKYHLNAGITPTYTSSREWLVLEWDNVERTGTPGQLVDFEMFLRMNINYEPGNYEMLFAYDNLQMVDGSGSIGFKAADGRILVDGDMPVDLTLGDSVAYNNLDAVISNKFVVCMDYTGPEESQFNVKFNAYVSEKAAGTTQTLMVENHLAGADSEVLELQLEVSGNITLAPIGDKTVKEEETLTFEVLYADENQVSNIIEVSGDNFTSTVSGNTSGSIVTLTPKKHFHGETTVTVKVKDSVNPEDAATTSFKLEVISDGIEYGCTDKKASNYNANANKDDGSCKVPVTPEAEAEEKSSGGALGWLALGLLPFGFRRNRKSH